MEFGRIQSVICIGICMQDEMVCMTGIFSIFAEIYYVNLFVTDESERSQNGTGIGETGSHYQI